MKYVAVNEGIIKQEDRHPLYAILKTMKRLELCCDLGLKSLYNKKLNSYTHARVTVWT